MCSTELFLLLILFALIQNTISHHDAASLGFFNFAFTNKIAHPRYWFALQMLLLVQLDVMIGV